MFFPHFVGMSPMKKNTANGVITFHTPFSVSLLKSQVKHLPPLSQAQHETIEAKQYSHNTSLKFNTSLCFTKDILY